MPPTLSVTRLPATLEYVTDQRRSPSPQSPGTLPFGAHSPAGVWLDAPRSLCETVFPTIATYEVLRTRIPSKVAFETVKPWTRVPAEPGVSTTMPLSRPV